MRRWWRVVPAVLLVAATAGGTTFASAAVANPTLDVSVVESGLDIPWDVTFLPAVGTAIPAGTMLYTERTLKKLTLRLPDGQRRVILDSPAGMWAGGETGLMSVEPAADFATTHEFITCHGYRAGSTQDIRVVRWRFNSTFTSATPVKNLVTGLPSVSGRHAGCALVKGGGNVLYIGTGDAAVGTNPQNLKSGGGKVLRVDSTTGRPVADNPWIKSPTLITRQTVGYGHRNVQGLARRSDGSIWSVEQGSYRDDEVNKVTFGANYGWNPVPHKQGDASYNESSDSSMTDYSLPGAQERSKWHSGDPTVAASGGTFVYGSAWGSLDGSFAMSALKNTSVRFITFSASGSFVRTYKPAALDGTYGRLRGAVLGPDGSLYVTTSNGGGADKILKVTPVPPT